MVAALLCPSMDYVPEGERHESTHRKRDRRCVTRRKHRPDDANAQQAQPPALIAGDRPVTAEQVLEKLQTDGWSNVVISRNGKYIEVTGSMNGETSKMAVDSQTGRLRADNDDDDDD